MKLRKCLLVLLGVLLVAGSAEATVWSANQIQNSGFETDSDWTYLGGYRSTTYPNGGSYSLQNDNGGAYWKGASQVVTLFRGRSLYYTTRIAATRSTSSNRLYIDGAQVFSQSTYSSGWKSCYGSWALTGSGIADVEVKMLSAVGGYPGHSTYWDDISLIQVRSTPVVEASTLVGDVAVGVETTFSLSNAGGMDAENYHVNFDPDVTISSSNGTASIVWVSDTEATVSVTPAAPGAVTLTLSNDWSERSFDYAVTAVPEPMTLVLLGLGGMVAIRRRK